MKNKSKIKKYIDIVSEFISYDNIIIIMNKWNEKHRYWHNQDHLEDVLNKINNFFTGKDLYMSDIYKSFILAAFFHDVIYEPLLNNNENKSIEYLYKTLDKKTISKNIDVINLAVSLIESTKKREIPLNRYDKIFWQIDNDIIINGNINNLIEYENKIFKEYQFVDYNKYKIKRIEFLKSNIKLFNDEKITNNIEFLISYIKNRKIKIGLYAGSFNPMHIGHLNIIEKSEKIFDKVIVAYGNNPEKDNEKIIEVPEELKYRQVEAYNTLLTEYIEKLENDNIDIILIRGLRNGYDLNYESNQLSFLKDIKEDIKVIYISCDKKYEHISSSAIKSLMKFNKEIAGRYILK